MEKKNINRKSLLLKVIIFIIVFMLPSLYRPVIKSKTPFNIGLFNRVKKTDPDYIFIGNSMLQTRIDGSYFDKLTGRTSLILYLGGVMSSGQYLFLKNFVIDAGLKPEIVFLFFRDTNLTDPLYRVKSKKIESISRENEYEFEKIIALNSGFDEMIYFYIRKIFPIIVFNNDFNNKISRLSIKLTNFIVDNNIDNEKVNNLFALNNFKTVEKDEGEIKSDELGIDIYNFNKRLPDSFLPIIIQAAKENNIKLAFIRVKRRPVGVGIPIQSPELISYISNLKAYFENNSCKYFDFTYNQKVTLDMYGSGDHIKKEYMKKYTKIFYEDVKKILE